MSAIKKKSFPSARLLGYKALRALCTAVPPGLAEFLLPAIAQGFFFFDWRGRARVRKNLEALGRISGKDFSGRTPMVYRHFAFFLYEFFSARRGWISWNREAMAVELERCFGPPGEGQKSAILLAGHLGNWEVALRAALSLGYRISTVVMSHGSVPVDSFFSGLRADQGLEQYGVNEGLRPCLRAIAGGRILTLACERDYSGGGEKVEINGCSFFFPVGAAYLRLKTGVPIFMASTARSGLGKFEFILEEMKPPPSMPSDEKEAVKTLSRHIAGQFFGIIGRSPEQWITFHEYFLPA